MRFLWVLILILMSTCRLSDFRNCNLAVHVKKVCGEMPVIRQIDDFTERGTCKVDLTNYGDFEWDKLYQFHGPVYPNIISDTIKTKFWKSLDDGYVLFVFMNKKEVACDIEYNNGDKERSSVQLIIKNSDPAKFPEVSKSDALFSVTCERLVNDCKDCCLYLLKQPN